MRHLCQKPSRAFSLVEIMVVVVIILILMAILAPRYLQGGKTSTGEKVSSPMERGKSVDCWNNLNQIRQAHQMAVTMDEENPPRSLADLKAVPASMQACPVTKQPYRYDPAAGQASCPAHPVR